jgi:hypothetical protein
LFAGIEGRSRRAIKRDEQVAFVTNGNICEVGQKASSEKCEVDTKKMQMP